MIATETVKAAGLMFGFAEELMKKLPDYSQRKKEKFYKLKRSYDHELKKDYVNRDDERILNLYDELRDYCKIFYKEISGKSI